MVRCTGILGLVLCAAAFIAVFNAAPARAFIEKLYSLKQVITLSKVIAEGEIAGIDEKEQVVLIKVKSTMKGKCTFEALKVHVDTGQLWHPQALLKNIKAGQPALVFYDVDGNILPGLVYSCGLWFQIYGDLERDFWTFVHIELLMNRAYNGKAGALIPIVKDAIAGKSEPPAPNDKLPPITREELLGKESAPPRDSQQNAGTLDQPDGYEACDWVVEAWGVPAKASCIEMPGRGKVLCVRYGGEERDKYIPEAARAETPQNKVALTRALDADFSQASRLLFEASNQSDATIKVSFGIFTMDWQCLESVPIELAPRQRGLHLAVDLKASTFKCGATNWKHTSALLNPNRVSKLRLFVDDPPASGVLLMDRLRLDYGNPFVRSIVLPGASKRSASVSWADCDGDGLYDVLLCSPDGNRLYRNRGIDFEDVTAAAGLTGGAETAAWADCDGDGTLALALAKPPRLLRCEKPASRRGKKKAEENDLDADQHGPRAPAAPPFTFTDISVRLPQMPEGGARGVAWVDANGDGRPDLLFTNGDQGISLLLNPDGADKPFKDAGAEWGLGKGGMGVGAGDWLTPADADGDGFPDFLYNHGRTLLARNDEGKTFRPSPNCGIVFAADQVIGVAWGDFNNDGLLDLFVPQSGKPLLFRNNGNGTFTNVITQAGELAGMPRNSRTAAWGDVNRDGYLDLVVGFADGPAQLFLSDGKGKFAAGISLGAFKCAYHATGMAFCDTDNDGDLDLLIAGEDCVGVLVNACPPAPGNCVALKVRLPRSVAPGALVRLYSATDKPLGVRQVGLVGNFNSQEPPETIFWVPQGKYKASVFFTNGVVKQSVVLVGEMGYTWDVVRP